MKKSIIFILTLSIIYGCAPKKEMEQTKTITSMELPTEEEKKEKDEESIKVIKEQLLQKVEFHIEKREYENAILELNKAIELDPEDASLYYTLGNLYEQLGKDKESVEAFVKALQLDQEKNKFSKKDDMKENKEMKK